MLRLDRKVFYLVSNRSLLRRLLSSRDKSSEKKAETEKTTMTESEKTVSVALIGGGMTPAYTALLLKQEPIIKIIYVGDTGGKSAGLLLDASHVDTSTKIRYFKKNNIIDALREVSTKNCSK